ncbi:MAG: hypothetical protein VCA13_06550 [PS1 clade bacterium]
MKKIIAIALLAFTLGANAFWNNNNNNGWGNNGPWSSFSNGPWGGNNGPWGYSDNGIFGFNPYDFWDPRWYMEEMENMMDEFDNNGWGNNGWGNNGPWGYNNNQYMNNPTNFGYNQPISPSANSAEVVGAAQ